MQIDLNEILTQDPYSLDKQTKRVLLNRVLQELTVHHYNSCEQYKKMMDSAGLDIHNLPDYDNIPYLPVSLFKGLELRSVSKEEIVKTMTSSGTTGQQVSKIYLDRETSVNQVKVLTKIVSSFLGSQRLPMLIIDSGNVVKDRKMFSARGAGILGFSFFGAKKEYALDENMELDIEGLKSFLQEHKGRPIFLFGFTFMIWQHFYKKLLESDYRPDLSQCILIHGGGWKKLMSESVSQKKFKECLHQVCGIREENIHDYYGMVEQTGTVYMECECGHLHVPVYSDLIIRRSSDFSVADIGEKGIIEVVSILPQSYPGHILLTEDEGSILGEDDCPCGRKGKYFKVEGRVKNAEIRGCSDTYASKFGNLSGLEYIVGDSDTVGKMGEVKALVPFAEEVLLFFNDLSKLILRKGRGYSDVATFGFWCRRSALLKEKDKYDDLHYRLGRGIIFHSTPSNVPVNFAFSFAVGLLSGNANIVRLPAKSFPQVEIICAAIAELLSTSHKSLIPYICFVKYPPDKQITDHFSSLCQGRVIWGGDATIAEIRQSPLRPRAIEIAFADRYSVAVIDSGAYLQSCDKKKIAQNFYNDTYFSDQNACTAPRLVVWIGKNKEVAKKEFWRNILEIVKGNYSITPVQTIGKIDAAYKAAVGMDLSRVDTDFPWITRLTVNSLSEEIMKYRYNSGFFYEYDAESIDEIIPFCTEKCQTLVQYGLSREQIDQLLIQGRPHGIDRIVPIGESMNFTLVWDGYDLIRVMSRKISVVF